MDVFVSYVVVDEVVLMLCGALRPLVMLPGTYIRTSPNCLYELVAIILC